MPTISWLRGLAEQDTQPRLTSMDSFHKCIIIQIPCIWCGSHTTVSPSSSSSFLQYRWNSTPCAVIIYLEGKSTALSSMEMHTLRRWREEDKEFGGSLTTWYTMTSVIFYLKIITIMFVHDGGEAHGTVCT